MIGNRAVALDFLRNVANKISKSFGRAALAVFVLCMVPALVHGQETTGGLQGTVKDPSGALIPGAQVVLSGASQVGDKTTTSDAGGYYRFSNVPPGTYSLTVSANGFKTEKRSGVAILVGHAPSLDIALTVGGSDTVVTVDSSTPVIDVTSVTTQANISEDVIQSVPHGESFQSVIQFFPAARNEPLMGNTSTSNGSGGSSPGSTSNGNAYGYSIAGGADSENSYLVDGQETADVIGGYSHTNLPFDFLQEVELKGTGVQAEYGGALGGVVNAVTKSGTNEWHGMVYGQFSNDALRGSPVAYARYDPTATLGTNTTTGIPTDIPYQQYQGRKDKSADVFPGVLVGGPILKNRLFLFAGFNPQFLTDERKVNYGGSTGTVKFSQNQQTYYTTARLDYTATSKLRIYGKWLFEGQRESGQSLPNADAVTGLYNPSSGNQAFVYAHNLGYAAPNSTTNVGADYTLTPSLVSTTRFGYFFENYHDFGYPTSGDTYLWNASGLGQNTGYLTAAYTANFTLRNAEKHIQLNQDFAWIKSKWGGTHNFKFGYQLNRESNDIFQRYNQPLLNLFPNNSQFYYASGSTGAANCAALLADPNSGVTGGVTSSGTQYCTGVNGYVTVMDYGSKGKATSFNHSFFAQDSWTLGKGVTVDYGLRIEKEYLPGETLAGGFPAKPIQFGWADKLAPRIGAAWDVLKNGKLKAFGGYGVFNDVMKLNLAISSFGGQYWQNCTYVLNTANYTTVNPSFGADGRYCEGDSGTGANFGSAAPAGISFIENLNYRGTEGVTPGLKPYRQHETEFGVDYQLNSQIAFEARWDRRRLDHVIEDAALFDSTGSEIFTIVNPGEGLNKTNTTCATGTADFSACPHNIKPARSYDGLEFRVTKGLSNHWYGLFSYTYSSLRGNYSGLTSSDIADGGGGRNAPNNSRSFDETYFQYDSHGMSSSGPLATDRPNALKGYAYYDMPWGKFGRKLTTDLGIFQVAYSGTPQSSWVDVGYGYGGFPIYPEGRGKWTNVSQDQVSGAITVGNTYARRTPWYTQSDFNLKQSYKINDRQTISFDATASNVLNQRNVTAYFNEIDSAQTGAAIFPGGIPFYYGGQAYSAYEHPYDWKSLMTTDQVTVNSWYGKPFRFQGSRVIRFQIHYNF